MDVPINGYIKIEINKTIVNIVEHRLYDAEGTTEKRRMNDNVV